MLPHPARMCKHMRWGFMQRFPRAPYSWRVRTGGQGVILFLDFDGVLHLARAVMGQYRGRLRKRTTKHGKQTGIALKL